MECRIYAHNCIIYLLREMFQMKFHPHQGDETLRAPAQYTTVQKKETHTHRIQTKIQLKLRRGNAISVTTKIY